MGLSGYDDERWIRRFAHVGRPGPYLRVLGEGELAAGDEGVVEHRPDHEVSGSMMFRALTTHRELLPELLAVEDLVGEARAKAEAYMGGLTLR